MESTQYTRLDAFGILVIRHFLYPIYPFHRDFVEHVPCSKHQIIVLSANCRTVLNHTKGLHQARTSFKAFPESTWYTSGFVLSFRKHLIPTLPLFGGCQTSKNCIHHPTKTFKTECLFGECGLKAFVVIGQSPAHSCHRRPHSSQTPNVQQLKKPLDQGQCEATCNLAKDLASAKFSEPSTYPPILHGHP